MCEVFMGLFEELRMSKIGQSVRVTVAYSDTFPVSRGCHCNQLNLYFRSSGSALIRWFESWSTTLQAYSVHM